MESVPTSMGGQAVAPEAGAMTPLEAILTKTLSEKIVKIKQ